ncbi:hypothetical protein EDD40_7174 [Saccharothrix texasensis]|uniref:Uncharacterized protein n=1 Tax=Saccharothrix texasensis TaxID=103734 RepID=A0A3N1HGW7_9PSEU|nr:hypothetical protein EDD40_7174 [Saccharothrix texasensis]
MVHTSGSDVDRSRNHINGNSFRWTRWRGDRPPCTDLDEAAPECAPPAGLGGLDKSRPVDAEAWYARKLDLWCGQLTGDLISVSRSGPSTGATADLSPDRTSSGRPPVS